MTDNLYLPDMPASPMFIDDDRVMSMEWQEFFRTLFSRVGGVTGPNSIVTLLSDVGEIFSTPISHDKNVSKELEKLIHTLQIQKDYGKRINELEKQLLILSESKSYDKKINELKKFTTLVNPTPQFVNANKLNGIESGAEINEINGDSINGRVLRYSILTIADGTDAATLECQLVSLWNGDSDGPTDNVAKGATTGNYTLDGVGVVLKVEATGLSGNCIMAFGTIGLNMSGIAGLTVYVNNSTNDIQIETYDENGVAQDLTTLVDTGTIKIMVLYLTST